MKSYKLFLLSAFVLILSFGYHATPVGAEGAEAGGVTEAQLVAEIVSLQTQIDVILKNTKPATTPVTSSNQPVTNTTSSASTQLGPTGTMTITGNCASLATTGTCAVTGSFVTQNSFNPPPYPDATLQVQGMYGNGYYAGYEGRAKAATLDINDGVSPRRFIDNLPPTNSYTFTLKKGTYTFSLTGSDYYGVNTDHSNLLAQKTVIISDSGMTITDPIPAQNPTALVIPNPTGTLDVVANSCVNQGINCQLSIDATWKTDNSYYLNNYGDPTVAVSISIIDATTGKLFGGGAVSDLNYISRAVSSGEYVFRQLPKGSYNVVLNGWHNGAWVMLQQKAVTLTTDTPLAASIGITPSFLTSTATFFGSINASNCTTASVGGTCSVPVGWTASSALPTNLTSGNIYWNVDYNCTSKYNTTPGYVCSTLTNQSAGGKNMLAGDYMYGGMYVISADTGELVAVSKSGATGNTTHTFDLKKGTYNLVVIGQVGGYPTLIQKKTITVSDPASSTTQSDSTTPSSTTITLPPATTLLPPTGTISLTGCIIQTVGGTCWVSAEWATKNSFYAANTPLVNINVIDVATGNFYGGSAVSGVSFYQDLIRSDSVYAFSLKKGTYKFILNGWANGGYVQLDQKTVMITDPSSVTTTAQTTTTTAPSTTSTNTTSGTVQTTTTVPSTTSSNTTSGTTQTTTTTAPSTTSTNTTTTAPSSTSTTVSSPTASSGVVSVIGCSLPSVGGACALSVTWSANISSVDLKIVVPGVGEVPWLNATGASAKNQSVGAAIAGTYTIKLYEYSTGKLLASAGTTVGAAPVVTPPATVNTSSGYSGSEGGGGGSVIGASKVFQNLFNLFHF